ncbi:MAG: hypothetical protein K2K41_09960, partial [Ruminiclostridium sp.]|nr:hypothetical protein [Ruminiclostridium sp.]
GTQKVHTKLEVERREMVLIKKAVKKEIDKAIKRIWITEICKEYGEGHLLLEASLQCSLYHHLRNQLKHILDENNLYIYPEFYFSQFRYHADIAICEMNMSMETYGLHDHLTDIAAIIELKYGGSSNYIKTDILKLKNYVQSLGYDCQYYFGSIDERAECERMPWLDRRSTDNWANGCFTELNAGRLDGTMYFEVNSYNNMNTQQKSVLCKFSW